MKNKKEAEKCDEVKEQTESKRKFFVYAQTACMENGGLMFHSVVYELLNAAQDLASKFPEKLKVCAIVTSNEIRMILKLLFMKTVQTKFII